MSRGGGLGFLNHYWRTTVVLCRVPWSCASPVVQAWSDSKRQAMHRGIFHLTQAANQQLVTQLHPHEQAGP